MPITGCACQSCVRSETYSPGRCGSFSKIRFVPLPFPWAPSNGRGRYALPPAGQKLFWPALSKRRFLALEALLRCSPARASCRRAFGCQRLPQRAVLLGGLRERPSVFFPAIGRDPRLRRQREPTLTLYSCALCCLGQLLRPGLSAPKHVPQKYHAAFPRRGSALQSRRHGACCCAGPRRGWRRWYRG